MLNLLSKHALQSPVNIVNKTFTPTKISKMPLITGTGKPRVSPIIPTSNAAMDEKSDSAAFRSSWAP